MNKLLLFCVLAITVAGCSPSEKSIQKAVAKGDYQYIENYIANPKYWNNPEKDTVNAAAVEGLVLLSRVDKAVTLYKEYKGKPREGMIVKAFVSAFEKGVLPQGAEKIVELREESVVKAYVNTLINSKPAKMPENILPIINDDKNESCDVLLRNTAVKIEPAIGLSKIKNYIGSAIGSRKKEEYFIAFSPVYKAILWDVDGTFKEPFGSLMNRYSELKNLYHNLSSAKSSLGSKESEVEEQKGRVKEEEELVRNAQRNYYDFHAGTPNSALLGLGCFSNAFRYSLCKEFVADALKNAKEPLAEDRQKLKEFEAEAKALKKSIPEYAAKIKAKIPEVETAEIQLMEKLNAAVESE